MLEELSVTWVSENNLILTSTSPGDSLIYHFNRQPGRSQFYLNAIKDPHGNGFSLVYHEGLLKQVVSSGGDAWQFNYQNNLLTEIYSVNAAGPILLARYAYSHEQDLIQAEDSQGHSEHYRYLHHLITQRTLKVALIFILLGIAQQQMRCLRNWGDAINGVPTYNYQFNWDKPNRRAAVTDTRGGVTLYQFNTFGHPVQIKSPEGPSPALNTMSRAT